MSLICFFNKNIGSTLQKVVSIVFLLMIFTVRLSAQNPFGEPPPSPDDTAKVQILNAKAGEFILYKNELVRKLKGDVKLKHKDAIMYCDSAILDNANNVIAKGKVIVNQADTVNIFADSLNYNALARNADLFGDVVLVNRDKKLFTNKLNYNLNTKVATYTTKSTMADSRTQLTSNRGQFFVQSNEVFLKGNVIVADKDFDLKTDTLKYNTKDNIATFLAPSLIYMKDTAQFYTEGGYYDMNKDLAHFHPTPQYKKKDQVATADTMDYDGKTKFVTLRGNAFTQDSVRSARANTILYNRETEDSELLGNAFFKDEKQEVKADTVKYKAKTKTYTTRGRSKIVNEAQILEADFVDFDSKDSLGIAKGNVFWQDTTQKTSLRCTEMAYNQRTEYIKASGNRPVLTTIIDNDTLWLRADTIITYKPDPKDSVRTMIAYYKVRMFKKNFQAVCDSMSYTQVDSMFRLFRDPIVWSDTSQLTGDTVRILLKNKKLERVFLRNNGFIVNSKDEIYFNQIKGRDITAFWEEDDIRRMLVEGNAESLYYALDDKNAYIGVNKMICSDMLVYFGDNKVDNIRFYSQPKATMYPMKQADHSGLQLKGYKWQKDKRPKDAKTLQ